MVSDRGAHHAATVPPPSPFRETGAVDPWCPTDRPGAAIGSPRRRALLSLAGAATVTSSLPPAVAVTPRSTSLLSATGAAR